MTERCIIIWNENLIYIGNYEELRPGKGYPSMRDYISDSPYVGQGKIVYYLLHGKECGVFAKRAKDIFTGEPLPMESVGMSDGEYIWYCTLAYYVKKYNLRLPREFENKILKKKLL